MGFSWVYTHLIVYCEVCFFSLRRSNQHIVPHELSSALPHAFGLQRPLLCVWSGAAPWLIYFLSGTTAVCAGQRLHGLPEGVLENLWGVATVKFTFNFASSNGSWLSFLNAQFQKLLAPECVVNLWDKRRSTLEKIIQNRAAEAE